MTRISGVNVPDNKHTIISLTYIFGIGYATAEKICKDCGVSPSVRMQQLDGKDIEKIRNEVVKYKTEGDLRREVSMNIKRLMDLGCYRGVRHRKNLPLRGQRTKTNARTRKGPRRPISR